MISKTDNPMPGVESDTDMALHISDFKTSQDVIQSFQFHSAITFTADRRTLYTCIDISDNDVTCHIRTNRRWRYISTLPGNNIDNVFALTLSCDGKILVATVAFGHKVWRLYDKYRAIKNPTMLRLPEGSRNIPVKTGMPSCNGGGGLLAIVSNGRYVVSAIRHVLFVWNLSADEWLTECPPIKTLDAHFGRIMKLISVDNCSISCCHVISSSIDKSIKVKYFSH
jgi:WD40 repeat protein